MASTRAVASWWVIVGTRSTIQQLYKKIIEHINYLFTHIVRLKLTAEVRQGQITKVEQSGEYSIAKNTLVFGILVNWYFSQVPDPLFETTSENCINYKTKRRTSKNSE